MAQIVETIKLADEETEWNKLEYFDSLYNKRYRFRCLQKVTRTNKRCQKQTLRILLTKAR